MKSYEHIGVNPIMVSEKEWIQPGESFVADLPFEQENFFIIIGAIRVIPEIPAVIPFKAPEEPTEEEA
jgi:hypothetical protein